MIRGSSTSNTNSASIVAVVRDQADAALHSAGVPRAGVPSLKERWRKRFREQVKAAGKTEFIRQLLHEHQSREPYAELPENISLQLAALRPAVPAQPEAISQLAASLSDLYSKNQRELIRQKRLAVWGFAVGVLGLLASMPGIYALFKT